LRILGNNKINTPKIKDTNPWKADLLENKAAGSITGIIITPGED
jgi:hypothetical protein